MKNTDYTKDPAPILVTVYDRTAHLKRCITALSKNALAHKSKLFVVSDGPACPQVEPAVAEIRDYVLAVDGFAEVELIAHQTNLGSYQSGLAARLRIFNDHCALIRLEDDVVVSPNFLQYINQGLTEYRNNKKVVAICGNTLPIEFPKNYTKDAFFWTRFNPWGFGIWRDRWQAVDFGFDIVDMVLADANLVARFKWDAPHVLPIIEEFRAKEKIAPDAWMCLHMFLHKKLALYPSKSLTVNLGFDGSGENCRRDDRMMSLRCDDRVEKDKFRFPRITMANLDIMIAFHNYFSDPGDRESSKYRMKARLLKRLVADSTVRKFARRDFP